MQNESSERKAINATIQDYFEGMYHRDIARLRRAFHPDACLYGHFKGAFMLLPLDKWLKGVEKGPVPAEREPFDMQIVSVDITGKAAFVKVVDLYLGLRFTDYLSLARVDGRWLIVNKTFHHD